MLPVAPAAAETTIVSRFLGAAISMPNTAVRETPCPTRTGFSGLFGKIARRFDNDVVLQAGEARDAVSLSVIGMTGLDDFREAGGTHDLADGDGGKITVGLKEAPVPGLQVVAQVVQKADSSLRSELHLPRSGLEGDIFVGDFRAGSRAATVTFFGRSGLLEVVVRAWRACAYCGRSGSGGFGAPAQHAKSVGNNLETGALLTFLVLPLAGLNAPFDEHQGTLLQILLRDFRLLTPDHYFVPFGALLAFAVAVFVGFVGGHGEIGDGLAAAGVTGFGIAAQPADQDDFVHGHGTPLRPRR